MKFRAISGFSADHPAAAAALERKPSGSHTLKLAKNSISSIDSLLILTPNDTRMKTITLAFTGASGMPYGMRLLECLLQSGQRSLKPAKRFLAYPFHHGGHGQSASPDQLSQVIEKARHRRRVLK